MNNITNFFPYIYTLIFIAVVGCDAETLRPIACNVEEPEKNIDWLAALIAQAEAQPGDVVRITLFTYENEDVFFIQQSENIADHMDIVKNCAGETICQFGGIAGLNTCPDFQEDAMGGQIIWEG